MTKQKASLSVDISGIPAPLGRPCYFHFQKPPAAPELSDCEAEL